jgi:hypothetical protein
MTITDSRAEAAGPGMTARAARGYAGLSAYLGAYGAEDREILGLTQPPGPQPYLVAVSGATDEEARATVEGWAALRGITAAWDETTGTYRAVLMLGAVPYIVFTRPADLRLAAGQYAARRRDSLLDAVREGRTGVAT